MMERRVIKNDIQIFITTTDIKDINDDLKSKSDIYTVANSENFFLGENGKLYIIYAYGNQNFTSEMDIVLFE